MIPSFQYTSKKIKLSTLMAYFMFMFSEVIQAMEKIQVRRFQIDFVTFGLYENCRLG